MNQALYAHMNNKRKKKKNILLVVFIKIINNTLNRISKKKQVMGNILTLLHYLCKAVQW
jgi:hypothetical protein